MVALCCCLRSRISDTMSVMTGSLFFVWRRITHIRRFYRRPCVGRARSPLAAGHLSIIITDEHSREGHMSELSENDEPADANHLQLRGDHITLTQAVKAVGLANTGGEAKFIIRDGDVTVNGVAETKPGR